MKSIFFALSSHKHDAGLLFFNVENASLSFSPFFSNQRRSAPLERKSGIVFSPIGKLLPPSLAPEAALNTSPSALPLNSLLRCALSVRAPSVRLQM